MKIKVSELKGRALNYAVAVCLWGEPENGPDCWREWKYQKENGLPFYVETSGKLDCLEFNPSENWAHGGPLIDKYGYSLHAPDGRDELSYIAAAKGAKGFAVKEGSSYLIAFCRSLVLAQTGSQTIEIPDELMEASHDQHIG